MKQLRYLLEAAGLYLLYGFFKILPAERASAVGGWIGRTLGPKLAASRKARRQLEEIYPDLTEKQKSQIVIDMWENLARVFAEYPHLEEIARERVTVLKGKIIKEIIKQGSGAVFIGAHIGNWEVNCPAMLMKYGQALDLTYREPNNPYVARLLDNARTLRGRMRAFPKSRTSGKKIIETVKNKGYLGVLTDQKYNEGLAVDFLGKPAMTNPIAFQLAQKYDVPLVPVRCERVNGCHFIMHVHEPLRLQDDQGKPLPLEDVIAQAHVLYAQWIEENPAQWLWLHRRWNSRKLQDLESKDDHE